MPKQTRPRFSADHVGSLLRPKKLKDARDAGDRGTMSVEGRGRVEDEFIREAVKLQEDLGFPLATDGEYRRREWHMDFIRQFANVKVVPSEIKMRFHTHRSE